MKVLKRASFMALIVVALAATTSNASVKPKKSVQKMLKESDSVFVGTVVNIDESALMNDSSFDISNFDTNTSSALTSVTLSVDEIIFGDADEEITIVVRGGVLPDGTIEGWSTVPAFAEGDTYIIFIRSGTYTVHPIVRGDSAIMRIIKFSDRNILVDEEGHGIVIDSENNITKTKRITESMKSKRERQRIERQSSSSVIDDDLSLDYTEVKKATKAKDAIKQIKKIASDHASNGHKGKKIKTIKPLPLSSGLEPGSN